MELSGLNLSHHELNRAEKGIDLSAIPQGHDLSSSRVSLRITQEVRIMRHNFEARRDILDRGQGTSSVAGLHAGAICGFVVISPAVGKYASF